MFFDSHAHYDDERFEEDRDLLLPYMQENGVDYIINVCADLPTSRKALEIAENIALFLRRQWCIPMTQTVWMMWAWRN